MTEHDKESKMKKRLVGVCLVMGAVLVQGASLAKYLDPDRITFSRLEYAMEGVLRTVIEIEQQTPEETEATVIKPGQGKGVKAPAGAMHLSFDTRVLKIGKVTRLWFKPKNGATLQRSVLRKSPLERDRLQTYRYTKTGIYRETRVAPKRGGGDAPWEWERTGDSFLTFPATARDLRDEVTDPTALFYRLAVSRLAKPGDRIRLQVFDRDDGKVIPIDVTVVKETSLDANYLEKSGTGERKIKGDHPVLELSVEATYPSGGDFDFMGLTGDKRVFFSPTLRAPVLVEGQIEGYGKGQVRLKGITVK